MLDTLFDPPWWMPLGILAVGIYLFWSANRKQDATLRNMGLAVVVLTIVMMAVAWYVDTPTESAVRKTRLLITSVEKRDWPTFASLLDNRTSMLIYRGKTQLAAGAEKSVDRIGLKDVRVMGLEAERAQTLINVNVEVLSEQDMAPYPVPSNWRFVWQTDGSGWYLARIESLVNGNVTPDQVTRNLTPPGM